MSAPAIRVRAMPYEPASRNTRRLTLAAVVTVSLVGSASGTGSVAAARPGCNGLIAFASNRAEDAQPEIYSISLDGTRTDVSRSIGADENPQPSPDGRRIAFWRTNSAGVSLVVTDADGLHQRVLARATPVVSWAPESRRLATTVFGGGQTKVVVFDAATGAATSLGTGVGPVWSPDGSLIAFGVGSPSPQFVFVERPDGSGRRQISPAGTTYAGVQSWAPDGTHLIAVTQRGVQQILSTTGGQPVVLPPAFSALAWTPDGSRIVGVLSYRTLESIAVDGTDPRVITSVGAVGPDLLSPDGRQLVFERSSDYHLVVTDLNGNLVHDFGPFAWPEKTPFEPLWSPDGKQLRSRRSNHTSSARSRRTRLRARAPNFTAAAPHTATITHSSTPLPASGST